MQASGTWNRGRATKAWTASEASITGIPKESRGVPLPVPHHNATDAAPIRGRHHTTDEPDFLPERERRDTAQHFARQPS